MTAGTRSDGSGTSPTGPNGRADEVRRVVDDCARRRSAGERIADSQVIAAYPGLMPELRDALLVLHRPTRPPSMANPPAAGPLDTTLSLQVMPADVAAPGLAASEVVADTPPPSPSDAPPPSGLRRTQSSHGLLDAAAGDDGSDATAALPPVPRNAIPGYDLLREISRGGQAVVYQGAQKSTGRRVAVKVMREGPFASARDKARFDREVQILAALEHPGLVTVLDRGVAANGSFFLVMDYVSGKPLHEWLADWRDAHKDAARAAQSSQAPRPAAAAPDLSELLRLFVRICDAVDAAHAKGVVHRDLKPSNIRMDERGEPRVLDFGLARAGFGSIAGADDSDTGGGPQPVTITGQFIGSLPWASPEQAEGIGSKIDCRSDVYSLGVVLYQMLTDTFPYEVAGTMRDVLNNIITAAPAPPSVVLEARQAKQAKQLARARRAGRLARRPINEQLEAVVLKALSKRREDRYATAGEFGRDVGNYLAGRPTVAGQGRRRTPFWRRPVPLAAAAVLLACVLGVGFALLPPAGRNPPAGPPAPLPPTAAPTVAGRAFPAGQWVDLLAGVDPARDAEDGSWQPDGRGGWAATAPNRNKLLIPVNLSGDYEVEAVVTAAASDQTVIIFPAGGGHHATLVLNCFDMKSPKTAAGIELIDDETVLSPKNPATVSPTPMVNGKAHTLVLRVERDRQPAGTSSIRATFDGRPLVGWEGDPRRLSPVAHW